MTTIFLYRKTLREKLRENNVLKWKLGAEFFGFERKEAEFPVTLIQTIISFPDFNPPSKQSRL